ncbi:hybrid-cluster NAD(P)-dependent oxidoreductase [Parasalinivibrio latis]|uniref:MOSC N-terminal beta barrel domain-containing protein n=1 Tax=Parasalinivibrio latis TaxID=2952610 RepID=UPI0030E5E211
MSSVRLKQINIYPIKSTGGLSLSSAWVEKSGLSFDRRFLVADKTGRMITGRTHPKLVDVHASLIPGGVVLTHSQMSSVVLKYQQFSSSSVATNVWADEFEALSTSEMANSWLSHLLGEQVQLLYAGDNTPRFGTKANTDVSFADQYPLLVISEASLQALNDRSPVKHRMEQFRTNLVATGTEAFAEDTWKRIRVGAVEFDIVNPCARCVFTTLDPETGLFRPDGEPLNTLSQFRQGEGGVVNFGMNLIPRNEGIIEAGAEIEVLAFRDAEVYEDNTAPKFTLKCVKTEEVARNFKTFWFDAHEGKLSHKAGQHLPLELEIDGKRVSRRYTLSSSPSQEGLAISVKRVEDGLVSNWLQDNLQPGDEIKALAPEGEFYVESEDRPRLFLTAGSGVTPAMSMLRFLADANQLSDTTFLHLCRSEEDIPFESELASLASAHPGLNVLIALTKPANGWKGLSGRLSEKHLASVSAIAGREVFCCGPEGFMTAAKSMLLAMGLPESSWRQESFGIAASDPGVDASRLSIDIDGEFFPGDNQRPLLLQAEEAGYPLSYSCRAGMCGACKMKLNSGEVDQPDMPALFPGEKEDGLVLACCCVPKSDISLSRI